MLYLSLLFIGWISVYAATFDGEPFKMFNLQSNYGRQFFFIQVSLLIGIIILIIDSKFFTTFALPIYLITILLLIGVLLFGDTIKGSKSWIKIGSFSIQPAEFAKFGTALALSKVLSEVSFSFKNRRSILIFMLVIGVPALLTLLQGDTGSMLVFSVFILVLYREGLSGIFLFLIFWMATLSVLALLFDKFYLLIFLVFLSVAFYFFFKKNKNILPVLALSFLFSAALIFSVDFFFHNVLKPHQRERIEIILGQKSDIKGAGYNLNQSLIAIGSGGVSGKGFLKGTQTKFNFVPEQSTDFIFCTIGEEWGFLGSFFLLLIYFLFLLRIIIIAERQRSKFTRVYAYGVASILFFHIAINLGMTIGLMPVIGIPLPLVSYGGSSTIAFTVMIFLLIKLDSDRLAVLR